jgi:hypothetical protein
MDLFCCRNCVQNPIQGVTLGRGPGYCLQFGSIIEQPERTTCKYLHRKDLPHYLVDEATREHAAEFAGVPGMADLQTRTRVPTLRYSERRAWDSRSFDPSLYAVASYHGEGEPEADPAEVPKWRLIKSFAGSVDARKALAFSGMVRRYLRHCDSWQSSYRLVLALIGELDYEVFARPDDLLSVNGESPAARLLATRWEVLFSRLSGVQEYGWHASLDDLMHPMERLADSVASEDWETMSQTLGACIPDWQARVIGMAKAEGQYYQVSSGIGDP